ncbi:MAG: hypothetical protein KF723_22335 [Rhizobiaceae bacterium]|nr:hypothetical protein [Rhizobiaceae bacterium]
MQRFFNSVILMYDGNDCLAWPFSTRDGYAVMRWDGKSVSVCRLVCEKVYGPPPTPDHEAAHLCGKGHLGCVAKRHLVWKTDAENEADKLVHGTSNRGERHGMAKLLAADVLAIRELQGTATQREIARRFGVSQRTISLIHRRERWTWLEEAALS